jgi:Cysteine-rich CPXCG
MTDDYEGDEELGSEDAETEATVTCPHCGESVEITLDPSGGDAQEYIEDCEVCCNPWNVTVHFDVDGHANVEVVALDE